MDNFQLFQGDCLDVMRSAPANSVDSLVTDPPAGISFMNKAWDDDKGGRDGWIAWLTEVSKECYRVMKPGAHGLVWAIPRTSHWTATALENAGFEVRDVVTHLFGTGFPKSLDISKAIDKAAGAERMRVPIIDVSTGKPKSAHIDGGMFKPGKEFTTYSNDAITDAAKQWEGWGTALKPAAEMWILCRKPLNEVSEKTDTFNLSDMVPCFSNIDALWNSISDALSNHPSMSTIKTVTELTIGLRILRSLILGTIADITIRGETNQSGLKSSANSVLENLRDALGKCDVLITISAQETVTELADISNELIKKHPKDVSESLMGPSSEHYILIRKPISEKTVAANVLKWGVGGLNIDASRIEFNSESDKAKVLNPVDGKQGYLHHAGAMTGMIKRMDVGSPKGRFPANLVLDEEAAKALDTSANASVSRFYYVAKASTSEKSAGIEGKNTHPTVKSLKLMEYLIKLVTPPKGTILDPFMGSGSTGVAATNLGFEFIGIEKEAEYYAIAQSRIQSSLKQAI